MVLKFIAFAIEYFNVLCFGLPTRALQNVPWKMIQFECFLIKNLYKCELGARFEQQRLLNTLNSRNVHRLLENYQKLC